MTNAAGSLPSNSTYRGSTPAARHARSDSGRRGLALVERDGVEQALLSNVGNKPVELGALDQRQHFGERMKALTVMLLTFLSATRRDTSLVCGCASLFNSPELDGGRDTDRARLQWPLDFAARSLAAILLKPTPRFRARAIELGWIAAQPSAGKRCRRMRSAARGASIVCSFHRIGRRFFRLTWPKMLIGPEGAHSWQMSIFGRIEHLRQRPYPSAVHPGLLCFDPEAALGSPHRRP